MNLHDPQMRITTLFVVVFTTNLVAMILFYLRSYRNTGNFMRAVMSDRSTTSLVVHVISSILGSMQIYTPTELFMFNLRLRLRRNPIELKWLKFWVILATHHADFSLSLRGIIVVIVVLVAAEAPGALWTGSMTPIIKKIVIKGNIQVPIFTSQSKAVWDREFFSKDGELRVRFNTTGCLNLTSANTRVGSCPIPYLHGSILWSGSTATTMSGDVRNHSKIDSLGWTYHGPSHGVGSSPGLVAASIALTNVDIPAYSYVEAGYRSTVKCMKNTSSDYTLSAKPQFHDEDGLNLWVVHGSLPNSPPEHPEIYWTTDWGNRIIPHVLAWSAVVNPKAADKNMIAIAASEPYAIFNQTQCTVAFEPTTFTVFVNNTDHSIYVRPMAQEASTADIEPTGRLTSDVIWSLNLLSRMTPSLYESTLANTLLQNAATMRSHNDTYHNSDIPVDETELILRSVEESFTAMIDDLLVAFGASQLVLANSSATTTIRAEIPALQIGNKAYIIWCLALNLFLLLCVLEEAWRHHLWKNLPKFDPRDVESLVRDGTIGGKTENDVMLMMTDAESKSEGNMFAEKTENRDDGLEANEEDDTDTGSLVRRSDGS